MRGPYSGPIFVVHRAVVNCVQIFLVEIVVFANVSNVTSEAVDAVNVGEEYGWDPELLRLRLATFAIGINTWEVSRRP